MWTFLPADNNRAKFFNHSVSYFLHSDTILLNTYSDYTSFAFNPAIYRKDLYNMGFVKELEPSQTTMDLGMEIRSIWLRLILNPNEELCNIINKHISILKQRYMIGLQLRLGGKKANYRERSVLSHGGMKNAERKILQHVKEKNLKWSDVYIFISSDSDYAVKTITKDFTFNNVSVVYSVNDYEIGHSSSAKTAKKGKSKWSSFTKRAIIDMMILKESDYYVYSKRSTFGGTAMELQQAYGSDVNVLDFLYSKGLKCSVYHKRDFVGLSYGV